MAKAKRLFTIGYEQTPSKAVLDELERSGVKLLVDVRAVTSTSSERIAQVLEAALHAVRNAASPAAHPADLETTEAAGRA